MKEIIPLVKNEDEELHIPSVWRQIFVDIVEAFMAGDSQLDTGIDGVQRLSESEAKRIEAYIADYGEQLVSLPEETWQTSIYRWMGNYWQVLIDLFTEEEGRSDLVLFVRVYENKETYRFEVESVHVP